MSRKQNVPLKECAAARPGRPPVLSEEVRRGRILQAAEQVFVEIGYGATTMEEIARTAGMSKKTVYAHFPDKRALFSALISDVAANPILDEPVKTARSRAELRRVLMSLSGLALGKRQVELTRLVISEAKQCPELAEEFHERVIRKAETYLMDVARAYTKRDDTTVNVIGGILGDLHLRMLLGMKPMTPKQLEAHFEIVIDLLLPAKAR